MWADTGRQHRAGVEEFQKTQLSNLTLVRLFQFINRGRTMDPTLVFGFSVYVLGPLLAASRAQASYLSTH